MKFSARNLLLIDRFFWIPHRVTESFFTILTRVSANQSDHSFVLKFMGWGSLVRFASLCEEHHVDKSKITLVTFSQQKEVCALFGFPHLFIIRTDGFFNFLYDCRQLVSLVARQKPSSIIDFERCSHAVATFRLVLAWQGKCKSLSFEPDRTVRTEKMSVHAADRITLEALYRIGIDQMPKMKQNINIHPVAVNPKKILININASDFLPARRYPIASFVQVVKLLYGQHANLEFYFTGSQDEFQYVETTLSFLKGVPVHNKAGSWKFDQLVEELASCALFITGDSGPVHLAVYLGLPTIALWGPTQTRHFGYDHKKNLFSISLNLGCSPCFKHPASRPAQFCNGKITCLKDLPPAAIVNQASSLLNNVQDQRFINFPQKCRYRNPVKSEVLLEH